MCGAVVPSHQSARRCLWACQSGNWVTAQTPTCRNTSLTLSEVQRMTLTRRRVLALKYSSRDLLCVSSASWQIGYQLFRGNYHQSRLICIRHRELICTPITAQGFLERLHLLQTRGDKFSPLCFLIWPYKLVGRQTKHTRRPSRWFTARTVNTVKPHLLLEEAASHIKETKGKLNL